MKVTFLGHQGWGFQHCNDELVLVDPLEEAMGNGLARLPVWPARRLDFAAAPPIAGLVLTHEHSDHFDLSTLLALPYRGAVWVPMLASRSMTTALDELGYQVHRMKPYLCFSPVPGLTLWPIAMKQNDLERDVLGLLVEDAGGSSFLTTVDGIGHDSMSPWLDTTFPSRTVDNLTNNAIELLPQLTNAPASADSSLGRSTELLIDFVETFGPSQVVLSGQGWSHPDEHDHLNHMFFGVTNAQLASIGRQLYPHITWATPEPGHVFDLDRSIADVGTADFVHRLPSVSREYFGSDSPEARPDVGPRPWSAIEELSAAEFARVHEFIVTEFGQRMEAHSVQLMAGLYELQMWPDQHFEPTFLLRLTNGSSAYDYALDYGSLQFDPVLVDGNPAQRYVAGFEMWASDLQLLLTADEEAFLVYESSVRRWNNCPEVLTESIVSQAFAWFSPRFRPSAYLASYRRKLEHLSGAQAGGVR